MAKSPISFRGFDERRPMRIYHNGILPHWRQAGCTYFVTFRLADSLPVSVVRQLEYERCLWLKTRGIDPRAGNWSDRFAGLSRHERRCFEQQMGTLLNQSLDLCHGACVLRRADIGRQVSSGLDYFHGQRVLTGDFVVMPNHVHALLTPLEGHELENILHSIKSYTAREIQNALKSSGQLWQKDTYDHIVRDPEQLQAYRDYITSNPRKANLRDGEYLLSQAEYRIDNS